MREQRGYNPDADPQERIEHIGDLFEQQEYERAVQDTAGAITAWTREGRQEAALELAQKVEIYRTQIAEAQPELLNYFDTKLAEAYLYAGDSENDNLKGAEERYQRVADAKLPEMPEDGSPLTEAERTKHSESFHANDRLGDVAFVGGRYQEASERYADAIQKRAEFTDEVSEQGPIACAKYGQAANAFLLGEFEKARGLVAEAATDLEDREEDEELLLGNIRALENAIDEYHGLDTSEQERILEQLDELIRQRGGSEGGVKRFNFNELYQEAAREAEDNEG